MGLFGLRDRLELWRMFDFADRKVGDLCGGCSGVGDLRV